MGVRSARVLILLLSLLVAAHASQEVARSLLEWAGDRGVELSPALSFKWDDGLNRLIISVPQGFEGKDLMSVPRSACLGVREAFAELPATSDGVVPSFSFPEEVFVTWLLYHRSLGSFSPFAAYVGSFPSANDSRLPIFLGEEQWKWAAEREIALETLKERMDAEKNELLASFRLLEKNLFQLDPISFPPDAFTFDDYVWGYASIMSRLFVCGGHRISSDIEEGERFDKCHKLYDRCQGSNCGSGSTKSKGVGHCMEGEPLLVPLLDLLPRTIRKSSAADMVWEGSEAEGIRIRGGKKSGELMIYADEYNEEQAFLTYGAVDNPTRHIPLAKVHIAVELESMTVWRMFVLPWLRKIAPELLQTHGKYLQDYWVPSELQWNSKELRLARLLVTDPNAPVQEMDNIIKGVSSMDNFNIDTELKALHFLYAAVAPRAERLPNAINALEQAVEHLKAQWASTTLPLGGSALGVDAVEDSEAVTPSLVTALQYYTHTLTEAAALTKRLTHMWETVLQFE